MIAVDTGFLYAQADADDRHHARAMACAPTAQEGWITTLPVLTEACHLLARRLAPRFAIALMEDVASGGLQVWHPPAEALARVPALMLQYAALPMDLADASLLLLAEHLGHGRILSTDERDFQTCRWKRRRPFDNLLQSP